MAFHTPSPHTLPLLYFEILCLTYLLCLQSSYVNGFNAYVSSQYIIASLQSIFSKAYFILFTESANGQLAQMCLEKLYGLTTPYETLFKMGVGVTGDDIVSKVEKIIKEGV